MSFPNTGALPLIFIGALKEAFMTEAQRTGETTVSEATFDRAVGFIMLNACIQTVLRWSIGYDLMRKPDSLLRFENSSLSEESSSKSHVNKESSELMMKIKKIINPTLVASIVAIIVASITPLKNVFYHENHDAPLYSTVFMTIYMIGENGKSIMTLQLG